MATGPTKPSAALHPLVIAALIGFMVIFVLSAWAVLSGGGYVFWVAIMVTFFGTVVFAIPMDLWWIKSNHGGAPMLSADRSFHDWLETDMISFQSRMKGREAMVAALIPAAAAALAAVLIATVFQVVSP